MKKAEKKRLDVAIAFAIVLLLGIWIAGARVAYRECRAGGGSVMLCVWTVG